jgi:tagaturonate epimerase
MTSVSPRLRSQIAAVMTTRAAPDSLVEREGMALWLEREGARTWLAILAPRDAVVFERFAGQREEGQEGYAIQRCATTPANARALRETLPWLQPALLGLSTSAGLGDRLGRATVGHVRALRATLGAAPGRIIAPIFAQQSARENARTGRTPDQVLADATWGAFEAGWLGPVGADADHAKTIADIDVCAAAGYSFYTIDPGEFVASDADGANPEAIDERVRALPWEQLESTPRDLAQRYAGRSVPLESAGVDLSGPHVLRAAAKYGRAIVHVTALYRRLEALRIPFELEVSVDETATPTTLVEHIYIASELRRLGVRWVSLALRYVGRFEKGVEYIGDLDALARDLRGHAEVARALGPYKLSLHSGSDKFAVYPLLAAATGGALHLKTAGTSYVEALRVVAGADPTLFREIAALARDRYPSDRVSYHVSAEVDRLPDVNLLGDAQLAGLVDEPQLRQTLHVTYGSALAAFGPQLLATLDAHTEEYADVLERHLRRHLEPLIRASEP